MVPKTIQLEPVRNEQANYVIGSNKCFGGVDLYGYPVLIETTTGNHMATIGYGDNLEQAISICKKHHKQTLEIIRKRN